jgi:hypothetical protein
MPKWKEYPGFDLNLNAPMVDAPWNRYNDGTLVHFISEGWVYDQTSRKWSEFENGQIDPTLTGNPLIRLADGFDNNVEYRLKWHGDPWATCSARNCSTVTKFLPVSGAKDEEKALLSISRRTHPDPKCFFEVVDEMSERSCEEYQLSSFTGSAPDEVTRNILKDQATHEIGWDCDKCSKLTRCGDNLSTGRQTPFYSKETEGLTRLLCGDCSVTSLANLLLNVEEIQ